MNPATMMMLLIAVAGPLNVGVGGAPAQDTAGEGKAANPATPKADAAAQTLEQLKRSAARYRIVTDTQPPRALVFRPDPVLRWTNPLRHTTAGASFLWLVDGRPEAVASFYWYTADGQTIEDDEFQSLATTGLRATRAGQMVWAPPTAGITFAPIPAAPKPAATPAERLRQMRALAREFHAFIGRPEDNSELRLLTQPLYRYETKRPEVQDGALFAFVVTTDPEVLLMIEARPVDGALVWHYGLARMSMINLSVKHKDRHVWSVDWVYDLEAPNKPYVTLRNAGPSD
jgi:hypothetical protein